MIMRRKRLTIAAGIALLPVVLLLSGLGGKLQPPTKDYTRTPVFFVHGHGLYPENWRHLIAYLKQRGYPDEYLYAVTISPNRMANIAAAETLLAPAVEEFLERAVAVAKENGATRLPDKVDIVAHSMGAVSSRWYAAKIKPERVRLWIGLAGANRGSNALCEHRDDGAKDLCPAYAQSPDESFVQVELNGTKQAPRDETPFSAAADPEGSPRIAPDRGRNIVYFTVRIDPDEWIIPADSAELSGAGGVNIELPSRVRETSPGNFLLTGSGVDHMSMLYDDALLALVGRLLSAQTSSSISG